jgi:hypothetical protein
LTLLTTTTRCITGTALGGVGLLRKAPFCGAFPH